MIFHPSYIVFHLSYRVSRGTDDVALGVTHTYVYTGVTGLCNFRRPLIARATALMRARLIQSSRGVGTTPTRSVRHEINAAAINFVARPGEPAGAGWFCVGRKPDFRASIGMFGGSGPMSRPQMFRETRLLSPRHGCFLPSQIPKFTQSREFALLYRGRGRVGVATLGSAPRAAPRRATPRAT